jgi:metallo-beta-lactamase class B
MRRLLAGLTVAVALALGAPLLAQGPYPGPVPANPPVNDAAKAHIEKARAAAGTEWSRVFDWTCNGAIALANPPARRGGGPGRGRGRAGGPPPDPPRESWHADPVKVFDNLYFVGMTEYSSWAITTSKGIILLDAIYDYSIQDEVDEGLRKVGLNPADIKYVIVSHGHLDHAGGAKYLQDKYHARLIMSAADYDMIDQQNPRWKPTRDMVATDGMKVTLGDETLTLYITPGHTPGTISTLIPVRDHGQKHLAAEWGGTLFNFGPDRMRLEQYADSAARFRDIVRKAGADVILANHTEYDGSKTKLPEVANRKPGQPNPYVVGKDGAQRYLTTVGECAQAAVAALKS